MDATVAASTRLARLLATLSLTFLAGASSAAAQDPGVVVDPNSPAGKEYAIPLEEGRRVGGDAAPQTGAATRPSTSRGSVSTTGGPSLFGVGISKRPGAGNAPTPTKGSGAESRRGASPGSTDLSADQPDGPATAIYSPAAAGPSTASIALGTGGGVLALGVFAALAFTMYRRRTEQ